MKRKITEISIEVEELIRIVGPGGRPARAWCAACGTERAMATPQQAAEIARVTVRVVNRRVEAGNVHFLESPDGLLWVCVNSLVNAHEGVEVLES